MGQQQLLLLVLSTVIVGLATVAGIQAFDENQQQANQDALVQRAVTLASEMKGVASKPAQLGGVDFSSADAADVADALGLDDATVNVDGASGTNPQCQIASVSSGPNATINCGTSGPDGGDVSLSVSLTDGNVSTSVGSG